MCVDERSVGEMVILSVYEHAISSYSSHQNPSHD